MAFTEGISKAGCQLGLSDHRSGLCSHVFRLMDRMPGLFFGSVYFLKPVARWLKSVLPKYFMRPAPMTG